MHTPECSCDVKLCGCDEVVVHSVVACEAGNSSPGTCCVTIT